MSVASAKALGTPWPQFGQMTRFLVATASRGTTEAACEYLEERLESGDEVYLLTVEEAASTGYANGDGESSADDNGKPTDVGFGLARPRLGGLATLRTIRLSGDPARVIVTFARDREVDEIVIGPHSGAAETDPSVLGSTARGVLRETDKPVFVVGR